MKNKIYPVIIITAICTVVTLLLAAVNMLTAPVIERVEDEKVQKNLSEVYGGEGSFKLLEEKDLPEGIPESIVAVYASEDGGYVFQMNVKGFKAGLVIMCGISPDGKIIGAKCISSNETNKVEGDLGEKFKDITSSSFVPEIISGSTKTSEAYSNSIKDALDAFEAISAEEDVSDEK